MYPGCNFESGRTAASRRRRCRYWVGVRRGDRGRVFDVMGDKRALHRDKRVYSRIQHSSIYKRVGND